MSEGADRRGGAAEETLRVRTPQGRLVREGEPVETPLEALASLLVVVVIALFAFAFIGQNFMIPSPSMEEDAADRG